MLEHLKVLYLNIRKRKQVQHSLLNDEDLAGFTALATIEPYIYRDPRTGQPTVTSQRHWQMFTPTVQRQDGHERHAFRALLWINQRCKAVAMPVQLYDIVVVEVDTAQGIMLLVTAYNLRDGEDTAAREHNILNRLRLIKEALLRTQAKHDGQPVHLLIIADFNRHYIL